MGNGQDRVFLSGRSAAFPNKRTAEVEKHKRGGRTADLPGRQRPSSTTRMGDLIAEETKKLLKSAKFRAA